MFENMPILSIITFLPLLGALFLMGVSRFTPADGKAQIEKNAPRVALAVSIVVFVLSLLLTFDFDNAKAGFQFVEDTPWLGGGIEYRMGVDGISVLFILLTAFLTPLCILASEKSIKTRMLEYMVAFLILETLVIGVFVSLDLILFYLFFEAVLIPMFIIIGVWGVLWIYNYSGQQLGAPTTDMRILMSELKIPGGAQTWLWLAFFASFAVKMPMWPVHTWLPDAHVEAPTAGSVILAGILLKLGGYGFLRFSLPMFPNASLELAPMIYWLSVITDCLFIRGPYGVCHYGYLCL